jgi:hypothetical protein
MNLTVPMRHFCDYHRRLARILTNHENRIGAHRRSLPEYEDTYLGDSSPPLSCIFESLKVTSSLIYGYRS